MPAVAYTDEMLHYYSKLLSLRAAVLTGDQSAAREVDTRFKIIVPESIKVFAVRTRLVRCSVFIVQCSLFSVQCSLCINACGM